MEGLKMMEAVLDDLVVATTLIEMLLEKRLINEKTAKTALEKIEVTRRNRDAA